MTHRSDALQSPRTFSAWDAPTRWFHWINVLLVLGLIGSGLVILNGNALGLSASGKIGLKGVHVSLGYAMTLNLLWRFAWAFFGNRYARWRAILPGGRGYVSALRAYVASFWAGEPQQYVGHNPIARLAVSFLFLLLAIQMVTGLVLAGTDLFWPPFGGLFAGWVAAPGVSASLVQPGLSELMNEEAYRAMREFRSPFIIVHKFTFYVLAATIVLHIVVVAAAERYEGGNIISAMFTGRKTLARKPPDE